jgi:hypothetical protein
MLIPFYNQQSEIPEQYKDLYKADESGLYVLQVEAKDGYVLENVAPLKNPLARQKDKATKLQVIVDGIPDDFSFEKYEKDMKKFDEAGSFDREKEIKDLRIEVQKNIENEFKALINEKDSVIEKQQQGMKNAARETLYGKLAAKGWDKMVVKGIVESMTTVEIGDNGGEVKYIKDGEPMRKSEKNGDLRPYTDDDLIQHLTDHEIYGKLVPAKKNSGNGGESNYDQNNFNSSAQVISANDVGNNLEKIASGEVQLDQ